MNTEDYKGNDDLQLYDSVIKKLIIDHQNKTVEFYFLKVIERVDRSEHSFTYKVREARLKFSGVVYAKLPYWMEFDEWSEFYRSAVIKLQVSYKESPNEHKNTKNSYISIWV
ncbi:hypothetical protein [Paenibacillus pseudetheri]|uniref:Uncharacterized protein n=1 Tax=Paenibacillus pseudetheri TaxID=2897682 RepID=A0ABN8FPF6_9BACL|nr:hypothetical protein [Paenibacillus pseudetheri]CAH1057573.1 hypothetical protein PAECIP111894_03731 [Paenibacillus pseudetheri]